MFLAGIIAVAARGIQIECGCFGGGGPVGTGQHTTYTLDILRDTGFLLLSAALAWWPRSQFAADDLVRAGTAAHVDTTRVGPRRTKEAQRRLAELAQRQRLEGERRVRIASVLAAVLLVAVAGAGVGIQAARASHPSGPTPQAVSTTTGVEVGPASPKVIVDMYEDFQCPICRQFEQTGGPVENQAVASGKVQIRFHVISFLDRSSKNQYSSRAANAGYCAADAGLFEKYHDLLFTNQPAEGSAGPSDDQLIAFGRQVGATSTTFAQCVRTNKYASFVKDITNQSSIDGVQGTPTVLVNGTTLTNLSGTGLQTAISGALGT